MAACIAILWEPIRTAAKQGWRMMMYMYVDTMKNNTARALRLVLTGDGVRVGVVFGVITALPT